MTLETAGSAADVEVLVNGEVAARVPVERLRLFRSKDEALQAYREAAGELQRRYAESGGQSCR